MNQSKLKKQNLKLKNKVAELEKQIVELKKANTQFLYYLIELKRNLGFGNITK